MAAAMGPGPPSPPLLDWRDSRHYSYEPAPCRYCQRLTHLRDSQRHASCKTCAEDAIAAQAAEQADAHPLTTRRGT